MPGTGAVDVERVEPYGGGHVLRQSFRTEFHLQAPEDLTISSLPKLMSAGSGRHRQVPGIRIYPGLVINDPSVAGSIATDED